MASIIIFAMLWAILLKERWGTGRRTTTLVTCGLLLIKSTTTLGYGNYLKVAEPVIGSRRLFKMK